MSAPRRCTVPPQSGRAMRVRTGETIRHLESPTQTDPK